MRFFHNTNINFVGSRNLFFYVSAIVIVAGLLSVFILKPVFGIDFEGGSEVTVEFSDRVQTEDIRAAIEKEFPGSEIKTYGYISDQYLIRIKETEDPAEKLSEALKQAFPDQFHMNEEGYENSITEVDKIGPKIGKELRTDAIIAVLVSVLVILIYIAFRFEFNFGLGAIVALVHDVIFTFSVIVVAHHVGLINLEINQAILAAMLTVIGYSINDTVIIFDRIRENNDKLKGMSFTKLVNQSINETLSRTIITLLTSLLVVITIIFAGGPVLQGFAFTLFIGIITGTYSSIYIASSFVIWYLDKVKKVDVEKSIASKKMASKKLKK